MVVCPFCGSESVWDLSSGEDGFIKYSCGSVLISGRTERTETCFLRMATCHLREMVQAIEDNDSYSEMRRIAASASENLVGLDNLSRVTDG